MIVYLYLVSGQCFRQLLSGWGSQMECVFDAQSYSVSGVDSDEVCLASW